MELVQQVITQTAVKPVGDDLERKIRDRSAQLGVIGLGYMGLPLAVDMAQQGFRVTGIDIDGSKVESVNAGISYVPGLPNEVLLTAIENGTIRATQSFAALESLDTISICVPTPLRKSRDPDLSYIIAALEAVHNHITPGKLIVLESTIYPGTSREVVLPILEKSGLKAGSNFFLAYSPKRVDPGNKAFTTGNFPKVIGGITPRCTELATLLYQQFVERTVVVSSAESAEMVKLLENTFRSVNIAIAGEVARICRKFSINVWEVIDAVNNEPFGFMPSFYPGPKLDGHCMPVDPYYLSWKARMNGFGPRLIELAALIHNGMPAFTINWIADALNKNKKSLNGSHILALGIAYKRDTNDTRESPSLDVIKGLRKKGAIVSYSDPHVPFIRVEDKKLKSTSITPGVLNSVDCAVILTDHSAFNYSMISEHAKLILDCRSALRGYASPNVMHL
jgi:UDP-N-acetyl-D-glucosamine dehydrogenase